MSFALVFLVALTLLFGVVCVGVAFGVRWRSPRSRGWFWGLLSAGVLAQAWWVLMAGILFVKFVVLGEDT